MFNFFFFFFQAEDGIRDRDVTGVQTCALPICQKDDVMNSGQESGQSLPPGPARQARAAEATSHQAGLRSLGQPNALARQFDFRDDSYEWRRLFAEMFGTFLLVLAAAGGPMVNARFGGNVISH